MTKDKKPLRPILKKGPYKEYGPRNPNEPRPPDMKTVRFYLPMFVRLVRVYDPLTQQFKTWVQTSLNENFPRGITLYQNGNSGEEQIPQDENNNVDSSSSSDEEDHPQNESDGSPAESYDSAVDSLSDSSSDEYTDDSTDECTDSCPNKYTNESTDEESEQE